MQDFSLWDFQIASTTQLMAFSCCIELSLYQTKAYSPKNICCVF